MASWGGINSDTPPQLEEEQVFPPVQNNWIQGIFIKNRQL